MLLKSSSTPQVQAISSDTPDDHNNRPTNTDEHLSSFSCNSLSDSNLEGSNSVGLEEIYNSMSESMQKHDEKSTLHTEPSFSMYSSSDKFESIEEMLERSATVGESIESQFSFGKNVMRSIINEEDLIEEEDVNEEDDPVKYYGKMIHDDPSNPLILRNYAEYLESKKDFSGAEEYYFRATMADPNDGVILSRYAKLVWELHGDKTRVSNYFERAIQASPEDSDVLAAYASFLWKIDESDDEVEGSYNTSQVDERSIDYIEEKRPSSPPLHLAMGLGLGMGMGMDIGGYGGDYMIPQSNESNGVEEYYMMMVETNPHNPLFLKNYAQFLHRSKGDLWGAEEYYSRAILEDPTDGYVLSLYADIAWELHRDKDRAVSYFERAVEAAPEDSNVLAAYAKFLWETDDEETVIEGAQVPMISTAIDAIKC